MKDFLTYLISSIVDTPQEVKIEEREVGEGQFHYIVSAKKEEIGKIIGREGKIIQAIRNIAKILAVKEGKQIRIEIASTL